MTVVPNAVAGTSKQGPQKPTAGRSMRGLTLRIISGIFAIPFLLGVAYFGGLAPGTPGSRAKSR